MQAARPVGFYITLVSTRPKKYVDVLHKRAVQLGTFAGKLDA
jgi:hypothetical protein